MWMQIGWALILVVMLFFMIPRLNAALKESPKGSTAQWMGALIPLGLVLLFVLLLVKLS
jgi:hypothetical protein